MFNHAWWYPSSKGKTLGLSIMWCALMLAGLYLTVSQAFPACGCFTWLFFFLALGYFLTWLFRREDDQRRVAQARAERYVEADPDAYGAPARRTTPGSSYIGLDFGSKPTPPESV